jgi:hypothetical protein
VDGIPVPVSGYGGPVTVAGYKVAWVATRDSAKLDNNTFGCKEIGVGTIPNGASVRYPVLEFCASYPGSAGNAIGVTLAPQLQSDTSPFSATVFNESKNYPYTFMLKKIVNELTGKLGVVKNNFASTFANFLLEKNKRDTGTGAFVDAAKVISSAYVRTLDDINTNLLGYVHVYDDNVLTLLTMFYNAEKLVTDTYRDSLINNAGGTPNLYAINLLTFTSSNGSPYQAIKVVDTGESVRLGKDVTVMLGGGTDGTMTIDAFDAAVAADLVNYNDPAHGYMDLVLHPESHIYDTGFEMATKKAMANFIARRRDTYAVCGTYVYGDDTTDESLQTQISRAQALQSTFALYPESVVFGTPVVRASIVSGGCLIANSLYEARVPVTIAVAIKAARYMGASNGKWKNGYIFDSAPNSVLTEVTDVDSTWIPTTTRNALWSAGITFTGNYTTRQRFLTAMKTVYSNDTSVLNSFFVATAICYLNKIEHAAWREFTGNISLTPGQFKTAVNNFVATQLKDAFDGKFVIIPDCQITEFDANRGYSWTLVVKIGANNMRTVCTTSVEAYRMADLAA